MWNSRQLYSQICQLRLFYDVFSPGQLIPHIIHSAFSPYSMTGKAPYPVAVNLLVTSACNAHCTMCNYKGLLRQSARQELTAQEIRAFLRRESHQRFHICLSGGEPFMREDIFEIMNDIKEHKYTCGIFTNGTLLDEKKIEDLARLDIDYIFFSLLGTQKIHDETTGIDGAFDRILANIRLLSRLRRTTKIFVNCAITESNIENLPAVAACVEKSGADVLRFEHTNFMTQEEKARQETLCWKKFQGDAAGYMTHFADQRSVCEMKLYASHIAAARKIMKNALMPIFFKPHLNDAEIERWYSTEALQIKRKCFFVWRSLFIDPFGDVVPCQFFFCKLGNIKEQTITEIWNNAVYRRLRLRLQNERMPICARCCKL